MTYQVLARKWRPRDFPSLVGQEHVTRALINGLDHDRLHHAFLFTGTRGVGKTTIARILAKALNCEHGVSSSPCGNCSACTEIDSGRFVDLIEVDAASRTKVDDTRELLDNVQYAPARGRFKVYLIDEVHMLSGHSFNALLKTLEEPPGHVKFLLATTDPQKLPMTVLSRCLQFNLKRLPVDLITGHLEFVLGEEGIEYDAAALKLIARGAEGSMRDALSLLDQAIGYGGGRVGEADTRAMLGSIDRGRLLELLRHLASGDGKGTIDAALAMLDQSPDPAALLDELATALQRVALLQIVPDAAGDSDEGLQEFTTAMDPEDIQIAYQVAVQGRRDLPLAPDPRAGLEMVLIRMLAFVPDSMAGKAGGRQAERSVRARSKPAEPAARAGTQPEAGAWAQMLEKLALRGAARQLALHCVSRGWEGRVLHLELDAAYEQLRTQAAEQRLQQALKEHHGDDVLLRIHSGRPDAETPAQTMDRQAVERRDGAAAALEEDPNLKALSETFGATYDPGAVRPLD